MTSFKRTVTYWVGIFMLINVFIHVLVVKIYLISMDAKSVGMTVFLTLVLSIALAVFDYALGNKKS